MEQIQALVPDGISVTDITLDKSNKITINGKSNTSESFAAYIGNILDPEKGGKNFSDINLGSITTTKEGELQFTVSMALITPGGTQ
jgi:hypothetical protein